MKKLIWIGATVAALFGARAAGAAKKAPAKPVLAQNEKRQWQRYRFGEAARDRAAPSPGLIGGIRSRYPEARGCSIGLCPG
jgi:hypothetical protein